MFKVLGRDFVDDLIYNDEKVAFSKEKKNPRLETRVQKPNHYFEIKMSKICTLFLL